MECFAAKPNLSNQINVSIYLFEKPGAPPPYAEAVSAAIIAFT